MVVRAKLGWVVLDNDQPNMGLIDLNEDDGNLTVTMLLCAMLLAGHMMHNLDDKWLCGDHGDLDANAPQHLLQDLLHAA